MSKGSEGLRLMKEYARLRGIVVHNLVTDGRAGPTDDQIRSLRAAAVRIVEHFHESAVDWGAF